MAAGDIWLGMEGLYFAHLDSAASMIVHTDTGVDHSNQTFLGFNGSTLWTQDGTSNIWELDGTTLALLNTFNVFTGLPGDFGLSLAVRDNGNIVALHNTSDLTLIELDPTGTVVATHAEPSLLHVFSLSIANGSHVALLFSSTDVVAYDLDAETFTVVTPAPPAISPTAAFFYTLAAKPGGGFWIEWDGGHASPDRDYPNNVIFTEYDASGTELQSVSLPSDSGPDYWDNTTAIDCDANGNLYAWLHKYSDTDSTDRSLIIKLMAGTGAMTVVGEVADTYGFGNFDYDRNALHIERGPVVVAPSSPTPVASVRSRRLGCGTHSVVLADRNGNDQGTFTEVSSVDWSRVLDDTSEATVAISSPGGACCQLLRFVDSWATSAVIYRESDAGGVDRVWEGPVTSWSEDPGGVFTLKAKDVTAWLDKRYLHGTLDFRKSAGGGPQTLAFIAEALIRDALYPDDPNVLSFLQIIDGSPLAERQLLAHSAVSGDQLRELLRSGLNMTTLGRRIVLGPDVSFGALPALPGSLFVGGVTIAQDGGNGVSRALVRGQDPIEGVAGRIDPHYGLLESLTTEDSILDIGSARSAAVARVTAGMPVPVGITIPDGSTLDPLAPVDIMDLVPGAVSLISAKNGCREVIAAMQLTKVQVTETAGVEKVALTFVPVGGDVLDG